MTLAVLTAQIGHYHDARYRAVADLTSDFCVLASRRGADFAELHVTDPGQYAREYLFESEDDPGGAVSTLSVWKRMQRMLVQLNPSAVAIAGWASAESFAAIDWAKRNRRAIVVMSDSQQHDAARSIVREALKRRIVRMCDAALVGGRAHSAYIRALGMAEERTFLGYDAVDNDHFRKGAEQARANDTANRAALLLPEKYILGSARFIAKKNIPRLIRAYRMAIAETSSAPDLVILGDGPERQTIETEIAKQGLQNKVHLPGFFGYEKLPALYGLAQAFVHVSTSEQWGLVINEAAAAGLPLIVSETCGATETLVQHEENGFVVDPASQTDIANALAQVMRLNPANRAEMARKGQALVADWGPERFARELLCAVRAAETAERSAMRLHDWALLRSLSARRIGRVS